MYHSVRNDGVPVCCNEESPLYAHLPAELADGNTFADYLILAARSQLGIWKEANDRPEEVSFDTLITGAASPCSPDVSNGLFGEDADQSVSYKKAVLHLCSTAKAFRMAGDLIEARYWLGHLMALRVTHNYDAP